MRVVYKKIFAVLIAVLLLAAIAPAALAVNDTSVEAGKTAVLTFKFIDVYNVDGAFTVNDPQGIVKSHSIEVTDAGITSATVTGNRLWAVPGAEVERTTVSVTVKLTLKGDAPAGASCVVSFSGVYGDGYEEPGNEHDVYQAAAVTVKETVVVPKPSVEPQPIINYAELEKQIAIANGLDSADYTAESWGAVAAALETAKTAQSSKKQDEVDGAAQALQAAVIALTKMDYSELVAALNESDSFTESEELTDLWIKLEDAVNRGKELLSSGDQEASNASAAEISALLAQLRAKIDELKTPELVEVEVEVPVEVLPQDDFCNIPVHRVWPLLFFISLALNIVIIIIVVIVSVKRRNQRDDTPLIDYDIDDDIY